MNIEDINLAKEARQNAYVPYTHFTVGALLRTKSGKVFKGCNVENGGIQSICAERTAFVKALSEGEREFESITIIGAKEGAEPSKLCAPCGYCRQFMSEFVDNDFKINLVGANDEVKELTINDLLPYSFELDK
jgi:cytidine deaminase